MSTTSTKRGRLADRAYSEILDLLRTGELRAGQNVSFTSLSERLGLSRMPVTLALDRLQREGMVESVPRLGTRVRPINAETIWGLVRWRIAMECEIARQASRWMTSEERVTLIELAEETERELDSTYPKLTAMMPWIHQEASKQGQVAPSRTDTAPLSVMPSDVGPDVDKAFHFHLADLSRAPKLAREVRTTLDMLAIKVEICEAVSAAVAHALPPEPPPNHIELARTIAEGSPDEADACMRKHIEQGLFMYGFLNWYENRVLKRSEVYDHNGSC